MERRERNHERNCCTHGGFIVVTDWKAPQLTLRTLWQCDSIYRLQRRHYWRLYLNKYSRGNRMTQSVICFNRILLKWSISPWWPTLLHSVNPLLQQVRCFKTATSLFTGTTLSFRLRCTPTLFPYSLSLSTSWLQMVVLVVHLFRHPLKALVDL